MKLNTKYFGEIDYTENDIYHFPNGLLGFDSYKKYLLIYYIPDNPTLMCLQNIEDENLAFILMNPFSLYPDYSPRLSPEDSQRLGLKETSEVTYYAICVIHENISDSTINLKSPLLFNVETRIGAQVLLENQEYTFRHTLKHFSSSEALDKGGTEHVDSTAKKGRSHYD